MEKLKPVRGFESGPQVVQSFFDEVNELRQRRGVETVANRAGAPFFDLEAWEMAEIIGSYLDRQEPWRLEAACRGVGSENFVPEINRGARSKKLLEPALELCDACPVVDDCHGWADSVREVGVWGGRYRRLRG